MRLLRSLWRYLVRGQRICRYCGGRCHKRDNRKCKPADGGCLYGLGAHLRYWSYGT